MAMREAGIRVSLKRGDFQAGVKRMTADVQKAGHKMSAAMSRGFVTAGKKMQSVMKGMDRQIAGSIKTMATFGGAFAIGGMIKNSIDLQKQFRDISFLVERIPGQTMDWKAAQELVTDSAMRAGQTIGDMASAFKEVYSATGDLEYTKGAIDSIGIAATATGKSTSELATIAHMLRRKWGATSENMNQLMAQFLEKLDRGGLGIDELSSRMDIAAGEAAAAGMNVSELFGTLELLDARMGAGMGARGLKTMLMYMKEGTTQMQQLEKAGKIKFEADSTPFEKIRTILKNPKMHEESLKVFTETARSSFDELRKPFVEAYEQAIEARASEQEAIQAGLSAYDKMVTAVSKTDYTWEKLQTRYEKRMDEDPTVKLRAAITKVQKAFTQPKMLSAIERLADLLPTLADGIASLMEFITSNPLGAAGMAAGMRLGLPAMMNTLGGGGEMLAAGAGGGFGGGGAGGAGGGGKFGGLARFDPKAVDAQRKALAGQKLSREETMRLNRARRMEIAAVKEMSGKKGGFWKLNQSAMGAAASLAGAASMGYALGKMLESKIDEASAKYDEREAGRRSALDKARDIERQAKEVGGSKGIEMMGKSISSLEKEKDVVFKKAINRDFATEFGDAIAMMTGGRTSFDDAKETIRLLAKTQDRQLKAADKMAAAAEKLAKNSGGGGGTDPAKGGGARGGKSGLSNQPGSYTPPG